MKDKIQTCYISAPGDISLVSLLQALQERSISVLNPDSIEGESNTTVALNSVLGRADLVIGILSRDRRSDWTLFELGAAWISSRPILLIIPPGAALIPPAGLNGVLVVRANPSNIEAIAFGLDQFLAVPNVAKSIGNLPQIPPLGDLVEDLDVAARKAIVEHDGRALENVISLALKSSRLDGIVSESSNNDAKADFAVWVDELTRTVGNPLLIEVKLRLSNVASLRQAASRLSSAVSSSGTRYGLLLYGEGPTFTQLSSSLPFNVLALSIAEFLRSLRTQSFSSIVGNLRNQRVHGVES